MLLRSIPKGLAGLPEPSCNRLSELPALFKNSCDNYLVRGLLLKPFNNEQQKQTSVQSAYG